MKHKKMKSRKLCILIVCALFLPLLTSCGSNEKTQGLESSSVSEDNASSEPSEEESSEEPEEEISEEPEEEISEEPEEEPSEEPACTWNVAPKITGELPLSGGAILYDARIGAQVGFDRFVLEFVSESSVPESYRIDYVINNSGGDNVFVSDDLHLETQVQGNAAVQIVLAGSHEDIVNNTVVYEGPNVFSSSLLGNITEVRFGGSHSGLILWGIGVEEANGFRVLELSNPPRIVIDICVVDSSDKLANCLIADLTWDYPEWVSPSFLGNYCEQNFSTS